MAVVDAGIADRSESRVWIQEGGPGPFNEPKYYPMMKAGALSQNYGDITRVEAPHPQIPRKFITVGKTRGARERVTLPLTGLFQRNRVSKLRELADSQCAHGVQVHIGACKQADIFHRGWEQIITVEDAEFTTYNTPDELGALSSDQTGAVTEMSDVSGDDWAQGLPMSLVKVADAGVAGEITAVAVCDSLSCGVCAPYSNGKQHAFFLSKSSVASPTSGNAIVYTTDGGTTFTESVIPVWGASADPIGIACAGDYLVIISAIASALAYITKAGLIAGTDTWTTVALDKAPNAIYAADASHVYIAADDGYVYLLRDPSVTPETILAGTVTTEDLQAIHAVDEWTIAAVGDNNAVVYTNNSGVTWDNPDGPAAGVVLTTVWMHNRQTLSVGTQTGYVYATRDAGENWTAKMFPGNGDGSVVRAIVFDRRFPAYGFMAHSTAAPAGRILRTIDGGYSWYVMPEDNRRIPAQNYIGAIAVADPNTIFAGGAATGGSDGIIILGAAA